MFAEHFQFSAGTRHYFKRSYEPLRLTLLQAWCQRGVLMSLPTSPLGCACRQHVSLVGCNPSTSQHCRGLAADAALHRRIWHRKANTLLVTDLAVIVIPFSANRIICSDPARPQRPQQKKNQMRFQCSYWRMVCSAFLTLLTVFYFYFWEIWDQIEPSLISQCSC